MELFPVLYFIFSCFPRVSWDEAPGNRRRVRKSNITNSSWGEKSWCRSSRDGTWVTKWGTEDVPEECCTQPLATDKPIQQTDRRAKKRRKDTFLVLLAICGGRLEGHSTCWASWSPWESESKKLPRQITWQATGGALCYVSIESLGLNVRSREISKEQPPTYHVFKWLKHCVWFDKNGPGRVKNLSLG